MSYIFNFMVQVIILSGTFNFMVHLFNCMYLFHFVVIHIIIFTLLVFQFKLQPDEPTFCYGWGGGEKGVLRTTFPSLATLFPSK